jgi:hypothetical protein
MRSECLRGNSLNKLSSQRREPEQLISAQTLAAEKKLSKTSRIWQIKGSILLFSNLDALVKSRKTYFFVIPAKADQRRSLAGIREKQVRPDPGVNPFRREKGRAFEASI